MKLKIISVGKTKRGYIRQGIDEYLTRLNYYIPVEWVEIPSYKKSKASLLKDVLKQEAEKIKSRCHPLALIVVLAELGNRFSSLEFARWIEKKMIEGRQEIDFIIGGELGIDSSIISHASLCLSLSPMTFTHQMVRLILLEQLYRTFTIIRAEPYHHR